MGKLSVEERFWTKVNKNGPLWQGTNCWLWEGCVARGYGLFWQDGKLMTAHRVAYQMMISSIPPKLQIDHLCRVRHCVNPSHMEPVTPRENVLRGQGITAQKHRQTTCLRHGHPLDIVNTYIDNRGYRNCKLCMVLLQETNKVHRREQSKLRQRRYRARKQSVTFQPS